MTRFAGVRPSVASQIFTPSPIVKQVASGAPDNLKAQAMYRDLADLIFYGRGPLSELSPESRNLHIQLGMQTLLLTSGYSARVRDLFASLDDIRLFGPCDGITPSTLKNEYWLGRHGTSSANLERIISSGPRALIDHGLAATGVEEVLASSSAFVAKLKGAELITSPLSRASETCIIHADVFGVDPKHITYDLRLRERHFGLLDGKPTDLYPCIWEKDQVCAPYFGIEAPVRVRNRVLSLIASLEAKYSGKKFAFITHGDTAQITETWFKGIEPHKHRDLPPMKTGELRLMKA